MAAPTSLLFLQGTCYRAAEGRGQHWEMALMVVPNLQVRSQGGGGEGLATAVSLGVLPGRWDSVARKKAAVS